MQESPRFLQDEIIEEVPCTIYHHVDLITVKVNTEKVCKLINVEMIEGIVTDGTCVKVDEDGVTVERSDIFNEMMEGYFKSCFAPVHNKTSNIHALPVDGKKKRGKSPALGLIVHFVGVCGHHRHGCPTK